MFANVGSATLPDGTGWEAIGSGVMIGSAFVFGIPTGTFALMLGFTNLRARIPEFDNPTAKRLPPG